MKTETAFTLTFATNYNGVYINPDDDDFVVSDELNSAMDEISDTFPEFTYKMCSKWDYELTLKQEMKLCVKAKKIIGKIVPDAVVSFEYDEHST